MVDEADTVEVRSAAFAEQINAGRQHAAADALEAAHQAYAAAVRLLPLHPHGYLERGSVAALLGDVPGAVDDLGVALALSEPDEDVLRAHFNRGSALLDLHQAGLAAVHFAVAAEAGVDGAAALLARAQREAGEGGVSAGKLAESLCARGFELLGQAPLVALACFEDAQRLDGDLLWAVHGAAQANGAASRPHHARNGFTQVLERGAEGSMKAEALFNRASLLPRDADADARAAARDDLAACLALAEDPEVPFPAMADPVQAGALVEAIRGRLAALDPA